MTTTQNDPLATTAYGNLRGSTEDGVAVFRAVPYAAPPVGALRFKPAQPPAPWTGERDAGSHGPIAPQPSSRLRLAMGDFDCPQSEDCLTLTIWTPAPDNRRRPVLVWFHGGAFMSGAGSLPWYAGAVMARRGDMVVVGVNYRLGALGFMHLPGVGPPNLGLNDQLAALEWVSNQVAAFGGDPANITIAGQSAGGFSVLAMLAAPQARKRVRRAIVQSAPFGRLLRTLDEAATMGGRLAELLGIDSVEAWQKVSAPDIVAAQAKLTMASAAFANAVPPFGPVADGELLGGDLAPAALAGAATRDVMIGYTRDEMAAFFSVDDRIRNASPQQVEGRFRDHFGAGAEEAMAEYRERARGAGPVHLLGEFAGDALFGGGATAMAERLAALGRPAFFYRFDWTAADNNFLACHCIELPFVFNNFDAWQAPMLAGGDADAMRALAVQMQDAWIAFARTGDPAHAGLPAWPRFSQQREVMLFDNPCRVASDPNGRARWLHWP